LSERELEIIRRIQGGAFAHAEHDAYPDYVDYYSSIVEEMPLHAEPPKKAAFLPSKWEMMKARSTEVRQVTDMTRIRAQVMKIVNGIKEGRIQLKSDKKKEDKVCAYNQTRIYIMRWLLS
jgi:ribosome biogenesis protein ERB1